MKPILMMWSTTSSGNCLEPRWCGVMATLTKKDMKIVKLKYMSWAYKCPFRERAYDPWLNKVVGFMKTNKYLSDLVNDEAQAS